jgi:hypothetical protein
MFLPKFLRWQGMRHVYTLPWMKNRIRYSENASEVREYSKSKYTRSKLLMSLLTHFHLSKHSILVSNDVHAELLKSEMIKHFPESGDYLGIAKELVNKAFPKASINEYLQINLSAVLIREIYVTQLQTLLGVDLLYPLKEKILATKFEPDSSALHIEGIMHSLGLHRRIFCPLRCFLNQFFFPQKRTIRATTKALQEAVFHYSIARPDSWFSNLERMRFDGTISREEFKGELTAILVSSFSLASALATSLLCLAARPDYVERIRNDPKFARFFLLEVLRLYPPFRQFGYEAQSAEGVLQCPDAATDFMIAIYALHRNPQSWERPGEFLPERFMSNGQQGGFKYLPFGMGKRACPGRQYSLLLLAEAIKYVCSDESGLKLGQLPALPVGRSGGLISFPVNDELKYQRSGEKDQYDA